MRIAVAGGTGLVGSEVVSQLTADGHQPVVLARSEGVDLVTGTDLARALDGVEAIIDTTSTPARSAAQAKAFFTAVAANLQRTGAEQGVGRIVTLSIVGANRTPGRGHVAGKLAQEAVTKAGPVPSRILRATQFHDFAGQYLSWMSKGPFVVCPIQPVQTVAVPTVVRQLVRLLTDEQSRDGQIVEVAGPRKDTLASQIRRTTQAQGRRMLVVEAWLPGATERAVRAGACLPGPAAIIDGPTFEDWLAAR